MKFAKLFISLLMIAAFTILLSSLFNISPLVVGLVITALSLTPRVQGALNVVVSNPLIGKSKQSMGNATFSTWKGINVLKEKPQSVANPQTDTQTQQRSAFSQMVLAFRNMPAVVRAGFKKLAVKMSEFNAFTSYNLKNAFDFSVPPTATLVPADVLISKGTISSTAISTSVSDRSSNTIVVTFPTTATQPGQSATDLAIVAAYNVTQSDFYGEVTAAARSTGTGSITLPAAWNTGDTLQVYVGFYNSLSGESSDSTNIADTIVA